MLKCSNVQRRACDAEKPPECAVHATFVTIFFMKKKKRRRRLLSCETFMVIKAGALLCLDMDGVVMLRLRIPDFSCPVQRLDAYVRGRGE